MENTHLYPPDWPEVRQEILDRAGNHCEFCKAPHRTEVQRVVELGMESHWIDSTGQMHDGEGHHVYVNFDPARRPVFVVLSVVHLNHNSADCDRGNLKALCQRCKLRYEAQHKADSLRATRLKHRNEKQGDLLEGL